MRTFAFFASFLLAVCLTSAFFLGRATRRGYRYYICLSAENATSTCFYCNPQQSTACTGIQGPPLQVNESQATCLMQYCPVTGRRRREVSRYEEYRHHEEERRPCKDEEDEQEIENLSDQEE